MHLSRLIFYSLRRLFYLLLGLPITRAHSFLQVKWMKLGRQHDQRPHLLSDDGISKGGRKGERAFPKLMRIVWKVRSSFIYNHLPLLSMILSSKIEERAENRDLWQRSFYLSRSFVRVSAIHDYCANQIKRKRREIAVQLVLRCVH